MKQLFLITTVLTLFCFSINAQTNDRTNKNRQEFKNQGEQEDFWAEQIFDKEYSKKRFDKFKGNITINGDGFILATKHL